MSTRRRVIAALALGLASSLSLACGVCVEDRVAAVFDSATVEAAVAKKRHLAFFGIEGALPATSASRQAVLAALYSAGGIKGTAHVSLPSAACSIAFDPRKTSIEALRQAAQQRLAARGLTLTAFRVVDEGGVLKEPILASQ